MNLLREQLKQKIAESKSKVSELDVLISELSSKHELQSLEDDHLPVDGQPFIYQFIDQDKLPGVILPSMLHPSNAEIGFFNGRCQIDSDSSFICTDIQAVVRINSTTVFGPVVTDEWLPLCKADYGPLYFNAASNLNIGIDFGFRLTDEGTGRKLFSAVDLQQTERYIPSRFLGNGVPEDIIGPNYTDPLAFRHVFAKNTSIKLDIQVYSKQAPSSEAFHITRIYVGLIGYKVFGD